MEEIHRAGYVGRGANFHVPSSITPLAPPYIHQPRKLPGFCTLGILIKASSSKHDQSLTQFPGSLQRMRVGPKVLRF